MIIRLFLVLLISLPTSLLAMEEVAVDESVNFCMDTQAAINNDTLAAKYPDDEKIVRLVALRSGLCDLLAKEIIELDVDVFYPAALENVITEKNAQNVKARIICELANGPTTPEADAILYTKGVHVIPDFLANAGGVTVSYFEQVQNTYNYYWTLDDVHKQLDAKMTTAYHSVYKAHKEKSVHMRLAAYMIAVSRVAEAVKLRGWIS